ncbi:hypothetical protein IAQ61_007026 [Plenodomus lingam]|uniref:uncharacterized protein n=1 Tax=Leptosphaeria maculans TaxID=5022 RepID=UPI00332934A0|nr:hypothetical protein IAQ61_007026 [Plenodomus lingam]
MDKPQVSIPPVGPPKTEVLRLTTTGGVPFGVYAIVQFQPQAFAGLTLIAWGQTLYYHKSATSSTLCALGTDHLQQMESMDSYCSDDCTCWQLCYYGNDPHPYFEGMNHRVWTLNQTLTHDLQGPYSRGVEWPMMLMAISASVIQVVGLIPPYFELAKRNGRVIGISTYPLNTVYKDRVQS